MIRWLQQTRTFCGRDVTMLWTVVMLRMPHYFVSFFRFEMILHTNCVLHWQFWKHNDKCWTLPNEYSAGFFFWKFGANIFFSFAPNLNRQSKIGAKKGLRLEESYQPYNDNRSSVEFSFAPDCHRPNTTAAEASVAKLMRVKLKIRLVHGQQLLANYLSTLQHPDLCRSRILLVLSQMTLAYFTNR